MPEKTPGKPVRSQCVLDVLDTPKPMVELLIFNCTLIFQGLHPLMTNHKPKWIGNLRTSGLKDRSGGKSYPQLFPWYSTVASFSGL